jgi:phosphopentomutase
VAGRLLERSKGKDTTTGHWEHMGIVTPTAFPTYPHGFPDDVIDPFMNRTGRGVLGNKPASGTEIIQELGEEHQQTGKWIVYTSADSVFQLAAHEETIPLEELYEACRVAREILAGRHAVGRVIARPFTGAPGAFERTEGRRDYALDPPGRSYLDELHADGIPVHTVGKIGSVFNHVGVDHEHPGATNRAALAATTALIGELDGGLVFANLVETDQVYGHRKDVAGFHRALQEIDAVVGEWLGVLDPARDLLVITADHGCDPWSPGTDHTRERVPLLASFGKGGSGAGGGRRHDGPFADVGASVLRWLAGRDAPALPGTPFTWPG